VSDAELRKMRTSVFLEANFVPGAELLADGHTLARDWSVGASPFLAEMGVSC
jgi:hypothetical protein